MLIAVRRGSVSFIETWTIGRPGEVIRRDDDDDIILLQLTYI